MGKLNMSRRTFTKVAAATAAATALTGLATQTALAETTDDKIAKAGEI